MNWKLKLKKTSNYDYDDWLEFFRLVPAFTLINDQDELAPLLPSDGYAALMRWIDIFESPGKMDKLYRGRLDAKQEEDILSVAVGDDDVAFYEALIKKTASQMSSTSVSQQEMARLSQNMNVFRKELREIRSRSVKAGTVLDRILKAAAEPQKKPAAKKPKKAVKKVTAKHKLTSVKKSKTPSKAAGATKDKKTSITSSKGKK